MQIKYGWCLIVVLLTGYGCATIENGKTAGISNYKSIHSGMTKVEVINLMGEPKSSDQNANEERMVYSANVINDNLGLKVKADRFEVVVILKNGVVDSADGHEIL
jgi:hypothetical protein